MLRDTKRERQSGTCGCMRSGSGLGSRDVPERNSSAINDSVARVIKGTRIADTKDDLEISEGYFSREKKPREMLKHRSWNGKVTKRGERIEIDLKSERTNEQFDT